jgi:SAM-dependent methyltransferase
MTEPALDLVQTQIAHFDDIAERYYTARRHRNHLLLKDLLWADVFRCNRLGLAPPIRVLEPMCGYADGKRILERHLEATLRYSGFDYAANVIDRLRQLDPTLDVWRADVTRFEPTAACYDLVLLLGGLHHVPEAAPQVVRNLASALRPGGVLINFEPTHGNALFKRAREFIYRRNTLFDARTERAFAVPELVAMFERAGLERLDLFHPGLLSYVLYYNPDAFPALNLGGARLVRLTFALDRVFVRNAIGRILSFATLSLWRKPP